jgi:acyl dehydratase
MNTMVEHSKRKLADASDLSDAEWNKAIDEWFEKKNLNKGKKYVPSIGIFPPNVKVGYQTGQNNEYVNTDLIRHYADAIGDKNPLWRDEKYAKTTKWGGIIAPPTFMDSIAPTFTQDKTVLPPGVRVFPAGAKRQWFGIFHPGDKIHVLEESLGVEEKKTKEVKPYRLFLEHTRRTYINQRDEVVADVDCRMVMPTFHRFEDQGAAYEQGQEKPHYTQERLDEIHKAYEQEKPRGSDILYWEDVSEGEQLKPLVFGPLAAADSAAFCAAIGYVGSFGINWDIIRSDFSWHHIDPQTGEFLLASEIHFNEMAGKIRGGTRSFTFGAQTEALLAHSITNWMSDNGFLKMLDPATRHPWFFGDTATIKGKVTRKYTENLEHLVDIEVYAENQKGVIIESATAIVRLDSLK